MYFNAVNFGQRKIGLNAVDVFGRLAVEIAVYGMPNLKQDFQEESPTAGSRIQYEMVVVNIKHGHGEAGELPHRKILAEFTSEDGAEKTFKGYSNIVDVRSSEADGL